MKRNRLGKSGLVVSDICLGTMTFGAQAEEAESFKIMDKAHDAGVDFFDTAEMYPVPPKAETYGVTEGIVGKWLSEQSRESVMIATKVTGPGHGWFTPPVRGGRTMLDRHQIIRAAEDSLRRLRTDYIDLYQTHWPDHGMRVEETMGALSELVSSGKVRAIGCSNETCWGLMNSLRASAVNGLARFDTVQNNFSLINRRCESELAQVCRQEKVSLLPYSPLGGGVLTGKYNDGQFPGGARFSDYMTTGNDRQKKMAKRFVNSRTLETTERCMVLARELGVSSTTLALAWCRSKGFVASTIIGVSSYKQLDEVLAAASLELNSEILEALDGIEEDIPNAMSEDGLRYL